MAHRLGGLQLAIMRALWQRGSGSVAEVQEDISPERQAAYTTVATVLGRMERRGIVTRRPEGRSFIYEPAISEDQLGTSIVSDLVEKAFGGSPSQLVSHLLATEEVDRRELDRIKELVADHEAAHTRRKGNRRASGK